MSAQNNYTSLRAKMQEGKPLQSWGRGEGMQKSAETKSRYLTQLYNLLGTARRTNNGAVIRALSNLIARRGGVA